MELDHTNFPNLNEIQSSLVRIFSFLKLKFIFIVGYYIENQHRRGGKILHILCKDDYNLNTLFFSLYL
jgi:hypothetical protein